MLIFGHKWIPSPAFTRVDTIESIKSTPANSIIIIDMPSNSSLHLVTHCKDNNIAYALNISSLTDAVLASNLGASYALFNDLSQAQGFQKLANDYLFDMKMICIISSFDEIEELAKIGIDGVVLDSFLK